VVLYLVNPPGIGSNSVFAAAAPRYAGAYDLSLMWRALVSCRWARVDQIQLVPRLAGFF
jgi:hypothetical protein